MGSNPQQGGSSTGIPTACVCVTGEYTGDGTTDQGIDTGVSGQVKYVMVIQKTASSSADIQFYETTDTMVDDNVSGIAVRGGASTFNKQTQVNTIIAMGADGIFHVDDNGSDNVPNKNGEVYNYVAFVEVSA